MTLKLGDSGPRVEFLQIALAGFHGTVWDGIYGPATERQVKTFQADYMQVEPTGEADDQVFWALKKFAREHPLLFDILRCPCGFCHGFGRALWCDTYRDRKPHVERYHLYEYPGIHKAILWAYRAMQFYAYSTGLGYLQEASGYRCHQRNKQTERESTNHMGKAIDSDVALNQGEDKRDDFNRCNRLRELFVDKCNFQIGWGNKNMKALEPADIAPTWIHADVRPYERKYLHDRFFVTSQQELDGDLP